ILNDEPRAAIAFPAGWPTSRNPKRRRACLLSGIPRSGVDMSKTNTSVRRKRPQIYGKKRTAQRLANKQDHKVARDAIARDLRERRSELREWRRNYQLPEGQIKSLRLRIAKTLGHPGLSDPWKILSAVDKNSCPADVAATWLEEFVSGMQE